MSYKFTITFKEIEKNFSSASDLYTLPLREDVRERAERKLAERMAAAKKRDADASSQSEKLVKRSGHPGDASM